MPAAPQDSANLDPSILRAVEGAAYWLATLSDENCSDAERQAFFEWLRCSTRHVDEFLRLSTLARCASRRESWPAHSVEALIAEARAARQVEQLDTRTRAFRTPGARKSAPWAIAASLAGIIALGTVAFITPQWNGLLQPGYRTGIGEQRSIALEDGSVVQLNSRSRLRTHFSATWRAVELPEGEAIFRVAKDAARPFRVRTGATDIIALGTAFNVDTTQARTVVTVLEGRVQVNKRGDGAAAGDGAAGSALHDSALGAAEQLIVAPSLPVVRLTLRDTEKVTSWTERRLIFEDTPLAQAAAEFARYSPRAIHIADAGIGTRTISGVFDATDPASLVEFLREDATIEVSSRGDGWAVRARLPQLPGER